MQGEVLLWKARTDRRTGTRPRRDFSKLFVVAVDDVFENVYLAVDAVAPNYRNAEKSASARSITSIWSILARR